MFRNEVCLFLIDFAACCDSVSHAEVHDTHSEHNEEREQHMSIKGEDYVRIRVGWILERKKIERGAK